MPRSAARKETRPHLKRRVLPGGRSAAAREPYASIRPALPASAAFRRLSGPAVRLWLLFQADYRPDHETILPRDRAVRLLRASPQSIAAGFTELLDAGIILKLCEPCRPGSMGGLTAGRATVYDLPDRRGVTGAWKAAGDPSYDGHWRIDATKLRQAATSLSGPEAKVWTYIHARNRNSTGAPATNEPIELSASAVAEKLSLTKRTAARAIAELTNKAVIELARAAVGSAPALFRLGADEMHGASLRKSKSVTKSSPYRGGTQTDIPRIVVAR